jgi:predicted transposase YbfD/YdcC
MPGHDPPGRDSTASGYQADDAEYICRIISLGNHAEQLLEAARGHWSIENHLHWVLDVAFREVSCRVRQR